MASTPADWRFGPGLVLAGCVVCSMCGPLPPLVLASLLVTYGAWVAFSLAEVSQGSCCSRTASVAEKEALQLDPPLGPPVPAGREVTLLNEEIFRNLRRSSGIRDDFLDDGWSFDDLRAGGGKGGSFMAFVRDKYIVKELSSGDHAVLLAITRSYFEHIRGGDSLLCSILMHFEDCATRRKFFVMKNAMGGGQLEKMYDLKGCDDDKTLVSGGRSIKAVHKRIWNLHMWGGTCCWSHDRAIYYDGKVHARKVKVDVSEADRAEVLRAIKRDTDWLASQGLMDYSLLVGFKSGSRDEALRQQAVGDAGSPQVLVGEDSTIHLSIIDFLQTWGPSKVVANCIKFMEPNKATVRPDFYARRFHHHFEKAFRLYPQKSQINGTVAAAAAVLAADKVGPLLPAKALQKRR